MVELMAVYSPPMPAPVKKRNSAKLAQIPRQRRRRRGDQIDRERDEKQPLATEPIGEPAEEQRARHRAREIDAACEADIGIGEMELRALLQRRRDRARERHFEPIEDPGDAERDHDERMEAAPPQPVEPRRDVGRDDRPGCLARRAGRVADVVNGAIASSLCGLRSRQRFDRCRVPRRVVVGIRACFPPAPRRHRLGPTDP